jgi:ubiquinone/menaquinone biosynthesis C-methylase UbiE
MAAHYAEGREEQRLRGWGRLEFERTRELLAPRLPPPPSVVVDVGGGPGAYAQWLAGLGHEVHLLDPIELHVAQARAAAHALDAQVGDARRLPYADASADVVLLLGPLYHLTDGADRERALREARRVLRPGGLLGAATISRYASTFDGLFKGYLADPAFEQIVEGGLRSGIHRNTERRERWFTTAYFHRPDELAQEVRGAGFALEALLAVEGPAAMLPDVDAWLDDPRRRAVLMRALARVESVPELLGASPHLLAVARA